MMTPTQMHEVATFAVALSRMNQAAKAEQPIELTADENAAVVSMIQILSRGRAVGPSHQTEEASK